MFRSLSATGRIRSCEEGDNLYVVVARVIRKKRHSGHPYGDAEQSMNRCAAWRPLRADGIDPAGHVLVDLSQTGCKVADVAATLGTLRENAPGWRGAGLRSSVLHSSNVVPLVCTTCGELKAEVACVAMLSLRA